MKTAPVLLAGVASAGLFGFAWTAWTVAHRPLRPNQPGDNYQVDKLEPDFDGTAHYRMLGNEVSLVSPGNGNRVEMNAVASVLADGSHDYALAVHYIGAARLSARAGDPLVILADGERIELRCWKDSADAISSVGLLSSREVAAYPATYAQLMKIANSREVRMKVHGKHEMLECTADQRSTSRMLDFLTAHSPSSRR